LEPLLRCRRHPSHAVETEDGELVVSDALEAAVVTRVRVPLLNRPLDAQLARLVRCARLRPAAVGHGEVDELQLTAAEDLHEAKVPLPPAVLFFCFPMIRTRPRPDWGRVPRLVGSCTKEGEDLRHGHNAPLTNGPGEVHQHLLELLVAAVIVSLACRFALDAVGVEVVADRLLTPGAEIGRRDSLERVDSDADGHRDTEEPIHHTAAPVAAR
jgi:hypothetical protein